MDQLNTSWSDSDLTQQPVAEGADGYLQPESTLEDGLGASLDSSWHKLNSNNEDIEPIYQDWGILVESDSDLKDVEDSAMRQIVKNALNPAVEPEAEKAGVLARVGNTAKALGSSVAGTVSAVAGSIFGWMNTNAVAFWMNQSIYASARQLAVASWGSTVGPILAVYTGPQAVAAAAPVVTFAAPVVAGLGAAIALIAVQRVVLGSGKVAYRLVRRKIENNRNAKELQEELKRLAADVEVDQQYRILSADFKTGQHDGMEMLSLVARDDVEYISEPAAQLLLKEHSNNEL